MKFGLTSKALWQIQQKFKEFPEITKAFIFGSRAMGNYKKISDIDICVQGENISLDIISHLLGELEENISTPLFFDLVNFESLENKELKTHIREFGKEIYQKI